MGMGKRVCFKFKPPGYATGILEKKFTCGFGNIKTFVQMHNDAKIPNFKNDLTMTAAMTNLT